MSWSGWRTWRQFETGCRRRHQADKAYQENHPPSVFSPVVVQPMPKRWKRLRTGRDVVSPKGLALSPEGDGTPGPVSVSDRVGIG